LTLISATASGEHPEALIITICPFWFEHELDYELRLRRETTWALMGPTFSAHHDTLFSLASTAKNNIHPYIHTTLTLARLAGVRVPVARSQVQFLSLAAPPLISVDGCRDYYSLFPFPIE
jgi:hypothetical protein